MRVLRLQITGFGPFHRTQTLDFERAASDGILLIGGRTGSGKSSVLDAISFALYGAVPRYDGDAKRVRSDHCGPDDPTEVQLDFEMSGEKYRVRRTPEWERPKKRGDGTTVQKGEAELWRWDEGAGEWEGLAARPTDVAAELAPVLALNHDQFLQVILLAQNRFQRFLHAKDAERQALLRTLFASQRFDKVEQLLSAKRKDAEAAHGTAERLIEGLLEQAEARVAEVVLPVPPAETVADPAADDAAAAPTNAVPNAAAPTTPAPTTPVSRRAALGLTANHLRSEAQLRADEAVTALAAETSAEAMAQADRHLLQLQLRRRDAVRRELKLAESAPGIEVDRARADAAERAARVAESAMRAATALVTLTEADEALVLAAETRDAARLAAGDEALSEATAEKVHAAAGALGALVEREHGLATRDTQIEELATAATAATAHLVETRTRTEALPAKLAAAEQAEHTMTLAAAPLTDLAAALERAEATKAAAARAVTLAQKLETAQEVMLAATVAATKALDRYRNLQEQRNANAAGILAADLREGEPCAVCGSEDHPVPAAVLSDEVTHFETDLEAAAEAIDTTRAALDTARAAETVAATELATARAESGGHTPEVAGELLTAARAAHDAAKLATDELPKLQAETTRLRAERESAAELLRLAAEQVASAEASERAARAERDTEAETLRLARGDFESLATRRDAVAALAVALDQHAAASGAAARALDAEKLASAEAAKALTEQGFESAKDASEAELPAEERADLRGRISAHDEERQRIDGVLADPELQDLGTDPAPIVASEARLVLAREAARAAATADTDATHEANELDELLARVDAQLADSAAGAEQLALIRNLAGTIEGKDPNTRRMRLEVFVLAARLEAIVEAANRRLSAMVGGRYTLEHDDSLQARGRQSGLGLRVLDEYTGRPRSTESLSGGETFLASLSLALGLADVVTAEAGGISLDTIFIDEGFGSLDPDALGQAMAILDGLREGGRTVALISHVAEMKEQIPARIEVVVDSSGASRIEYDDTGGPDGAPGKDTPS